MLFTLAKAPREDESQLCAFHDYLFMEPSFYDRVMVSVHLPLVLGLYKSRYFDRPVPDARMDDPDADAGVHEWVSTCFTNFEDDIDAILEALGTGSS